MKNNKRVTSVRGVTGVNGMREQGREKSGGFCRVRQRPPVIEIVK
jgi:hypothetical protein